VVGEPEKLTLIRLGGECENEGKRIFKNDAEFLSLSGDSEVLKATGLTRASMWRCSIIS
jgi:hypothetical protein